MAARTRKIRHDAETRAKISASMLIRRMSECVEGKIKLNPEQVSCAKALLLKVMPDLSSTALTDADGKSLLPIFKTIYERQRTKV